jgi:fermentation-respiration switch protein FrsA (DUF1100 family)
MTVPSAGEVIDGARDVTLRTSDGLVLGAWFVPAGSASDLHMAVLVAPGNGGNRLGRVGLAAELNRRGLAVLLMDYRGYGGNPGSPSEDGLAMDAMAAALLLDELGYPAGRTIYFGESLGTGVVSAAGSAGAGGAGSRVGTQREPRRRGAASARTRQRAITSLVPQPAPRR